jgi:hypothetical protein
MTYEQAAIAGPLLNSYAHSYLGLPYNSVLTTGAMKDDQWFLIVARAGHGAETVDSFDEAKRLIDELIQ